MFIVTFLDINSPFESNLQPTLIQLRIKYFRSFIILKFIKVNFLHHLLSDILEFLDIGLIRDFDLDCGNSNTLLLVVPIAKAPP